MKCTMDKTELKPYGQGKDAMGYYKKFICPKCGRVSELYEKSNYSPFSLNKPKAKGE